MSVPGTSGADKKFGSERCISLGHVFFLSHFFRDRKSATCATHSSASGLFAQGVERKNETEPPYRPCSRTSALIFPRIARNRITPHARGAYAEHTFPPPLRTGRPPAIWNCNLHGN